MKKILITGGTGSLGRAILSHFPTDARLYVYSRDEQKQDALRRLKLPGVNFILGDVRDAKKLRRVATQMDGIIHTAALKVVPEGAFNPDELVATNIQGTLNVLEAAIAGGVSKALFISSDKAVAPTNVYGATKMVGEALTTAANSWASPQTAVSVVRFGNLIGSRGSITNWPEGKPFGLTSPDMTRFWVTLKAAVKFISFVWEDMTGGEIYVPKLTAKRVLDMLPKGTETYPIDLRQGERMYETLVGEHERRHTDEYPNHLVIRPWPHEGTNDLLGPLTSKDALK